MGRNVKDGVVNDYQLALVSLSVFDIGPRTRYLIFLVAVIGVALAFMESLVGRQPQTIPLDKIIHFSGYFLLSTTFVLALRPLLFVPGLLGLVCMGVVIEFLQRYTGRQFSVMDMVANTAGVVTGAVVGITVRGIYAFIRKEVAVRKVNRKLFSFGRGEVLIREGDPVDEMYIIKSGRVRASREVNGREAPLGSMGAGEVVGILGVVEETPQYATLIAQEPTVVYRMNMQELMESVGGSELPVSLVLNGLCEKVRVLANQLTTSGRGIASASDRTMA
ncbi:MAG: cyclic nucleotide-binding domain-containing protein [Verrucomicrobia bacterium]|nr:cyclic nucleotide-binding domain-containing protein [Verrucomicrobiota bacterium]